MSGVYHCTKCGAETTASYRPAGFDAFFGWPVYRQIRRCPNRTGIFDGLFSGHVLAEDRYAQRAEWFGFTDQTIPVVRR